ncbi:hypothetical protein LCGC14_1111120 [marine sediment metagenome]|uniref:Uncharacterized protein n=1 Tax=marine sediment metagenome TaxID=412755 RepID=A0A0F9M6K3_9ZZZZ
MDTSETYIKMCEKAARVAPELFYRQSYDVHDYTFQVEGNDLLWWLPRQDQLQILSGLSWKEFDKECLKYDAETKEQAGIQVDIERLDKTTQ